MSLESLYEQLAQALDGDRTIEKHARNALLAAAPRTASYVATEHNQLPHAFQTVMSQSEAHPVCNAIAEASLLWKPPQTSSDPNYVKNSLCKVHVELLGPGGIVESNQVRLGLYGLHPDSEYGIRTHPAEEIYVMLAGEAFWKRGQDPYIACQAGERSYHPSMMEHATRTAAKAFMSIYIWHGDISTDQYVFKG